MFNKWMKKICAKKGHKRKTINLRVRKEASWPFVAEDFQATRIVCSRCGEELQHLQIGKVLDGYTSVSMPSFMWKKMREQGYLVMDF